MKTGTRKQKATGHLQNHENRIKKKAEGLKPTEPDRKPGGKNKTAPRKTCQQRKAVRSLRLNTITRIRKAGGKAKGRR